jgi:hypothetical protein
LGLAANRQLCFSGHVAFFLKNRRKSFLPGELPGGSVNQNEPFFSISRLENSGAQSRPHTNPPGRTRGYPQRKRRANLTRKRRAKVIEGFSQSLKAPGALLRDRYS